jgi:hypothetical protein
MENANVHAFLPTSRTRCASRSVNSGSQKHQEIFTEQGKCVFDPVGPLCNTETDFQHGFDLGRPHYSPLPARSSDGKQAKPEFLYLIMRSGSARFRCYEFILLEYYTAYGSHAFSSHRNSSASHDSSSSAISISNP